MDPTQWNDRYATADYVWKADPNRFLVEAGGRSVARSGARPGLR